MDVWHFSFGKIVIKFAFPPEFLLVSEKRKISKFEPCDKYYYARFREDMAYF